MVVEGGLMGLAAVILNLAALAVRLSTARVILAARVDNLVMAGGLILALAAAVGPQGL